MKQTRSRAILYRLRATFGALTLAACATSSPALVPAAIEPVATAADTLHPATLPNAFNAPLTGWTQIEALNWPTSRQTHNSGFTTTTRKQFWSVYAGGGTEVYCQAPFTAAQAAAHKIRTEAMNIEHAVPADRIAEALGYDDRDCRKLTNASKDPKVACKFAIADMHNMWPAYSRVNSSRNKDRYSDLAEETHRAFQTICPDYERGLVGSEDLVEPDPRARGELARSLIYMHMVYGLPLDTAIDDPNRLLQWNRQYPPSAEEKRREKAIDDLQGNWNPLILPHP